MQEFPKTSDEKKILLIVDDSEFVRTVLTKLFQEEYSILTAENGVQALDLISINREQITALLLDVMMPIMNGLQVLEELNKRKWIGLFPIILITAENVERTVLQCYDLGADDIIAKPFKPAVVRRRVLNSIDLQRHKHSLEEMVREQTAALKDANQLLEEQARQLKENNDFIIDALSTIVEFRDCESGTHIKRMRRITAVLMTALSDKYPEYRMTPEQIETISSAATMHDIGKIAIPDAVLLKPGRLTPEEFEVMKLHTLRGCALLENLHYDKSKEFYDYCYEICRHHHERWDGGGYPDHLKGEEIPIWAQVVSIADVYDALISDRVYKTSCSHEEAIRMITNGECGVFNPVLMHCFLQISKILASEISKE